jgi:hypothetical protein
VHAYLHSEVKNFALANFVFYDDGCTDREIVAEENFDHAYNNLKGFTLIISLSEFLHADSVWIKFEFGSGWLNFD